MVSVDSLTFDLAGCSLRERSESHRGWMNADHVAHMLQFNLGSINWPFDLTNPAAATEFYRNQCADNGGVMLAMETVTAAGAEGLSGLFKYRSPLPGSLGMAYVGILRLPFQDCRFQINVEAFEMGTTGMRECAVMVIEGDRWPMEPQAEIPVINSEEELQALCSKAQVRYLPSDDPKYDASFPQHPLSLARARLARVIATTQLGPEAQGLRPYRVGGFGKT
jgi:hypothetical protein